MMPNRFHWRTWTNSWRSRYGEALPRRTITREPRVIPSAPFGTGPPSHRRKPSRCSIGTTASVAPSVETGCELLAVCRRARVVGSHEREDVDELLGSLVVGLDLIEQGGQAGVVVVVGDQRFVLAADPGCGGDPAGAVGLRDAGQERQRLLALAAGDQELGETAHRGFVVGGELASGPARDLA